MTGEAAGDTHSLSSKIQLFSHFNRSLTRSFPYSDSMDHSRPTHETASLFGSRRLQRHPDASRARFASYVAAAVEDLLEVAPEGLAMKAYWSMLRAVPAPHDLRLTARAGDLVEMQKLVNRGVDVNAVDKGGRTALYSAVRPHNPVHVPHPRTTHHCVYVYNHTRVRFRHEFAHSLRSLAPRLLAPPRTPFPLSLRFLSARSAWGDTCTASPRFTRLELTSITLITTE